MYHGASRFTRRPKTTSYPSRHFATNSAMISGGSCRSPSRSTHAFFVAISMPLRKAACDPKLRECEMPTTRWSSRLIPWITASLSSGLQSLTKMIS